MRGRIVEALVVVQGLALAVLVGRDGSPVWQVGRVVLVLGLTALAVLAVARGGRERGWVALLVGTAGLVAGFGIGMWHVSHGAVDVAAVAGLVCLATGAALLGTGAVALLRLARGWHRLLAVPVAVLGLLVVYPVTMAVAATNSPRAELGSATPADSGLTYVDARARTVDGVDLAGWYVPSRNGAAVVLLHGASSTRTSVLEQAAVLADRGYGVLLLDARGHGGSSGRSMEFGWYGDLDVAAAVDYLASRPDVDDRLIGVVGMSMGGEEALGAAAADSRIRAVVAEGATGRAYADKGWLPTHWRGQVQRGIDAVLYGTTDLLTDAEPPMSLRDAVARAAPTPVLLIAAGASMGDVENDADRWIQAGSPGTVRLWVVPGAGHIGGLRTEPEQWAERVGGFLDEAFGLQPQPIG